MKNNLYLIPKHKNRTASQEKTHWNLFSRIPQYLITALNLYIVSGRGMKKLDVVVVSMMIFVKKLRETVARA